MSPKVSVVIPVCNVESYLDKCLQSLMAQTLSDFEILCVDDGSTDASFAILKEYASRDPRFTAISLSRRDCGHGSSTAYCPNRGAGAARNVGMAHAKGDYLIFLDSDDYFSPELLERLYTKCRDSHADICMCGAINFDCATGKERKNYAVLRQGYLNGLDEVSSWALPNTIFSITTPAPWSKLYRRAFLQEGGFRFQEISNTNDLFFYVTTFTEAHSIVFVPDDLVYYRLSRPGSLQDASRKRNPTDFCIALKASFDYLLNEGHFSRLGESFLWFASDVVKSNARLTCRYSEWRAVYEGAKDLVNAIDRHVDFYSVRRPAPWIDLLKQIDGRTNEEFLWAVAFLQENDAFGLTKVNELSATIRALSNEIDHLKESRSYKICKMLLRPISRLKQAIRIKA